MTPEENEYEASLSIKVEHEHEIGFFTFLGIFVLLCLSVGTYDTEIRCALGSEKACVSLKAPPATQPKQ